MPMLGTDESSAVQSLTRTQHIIHFISQYSKPRTPPLHHEPRRGFVDDADAANGEGSRADQHVVVDLDPDPDAEG